MPWEHNFLLISAFSTWRPLVLSARFSAIGLSMDMFIFQFSCLGSIIFCWFLCFQLVDLSCLQRDLALSVCPWTCSYSNFHALGASFFADFWVFNLGTCSAFSATQHQRFVHGHVHILIPMPWEHRLSLIFEFVRQISKRNQLVTCVIKIGEERGRKSALARALRTDKNRYIEASRVFSYRFFSVERLLGATLEALWDHFELKNRLGGSIRSMFWSDVDFLGSWQINLEDFGGLQGRFLEVFSMFFGYRFCNRFPSAFKTIFHGFSCPRGKQKWANCMGGPTKIKVSCCLLSNVFGNWFQRDFGIGLKRLFRQAIIPLISSVIQSFV